MPILQWRKDTPIKMKRSWTFTPIRALREIYLETPNHVQWTMRVSSIYCRCETSTMVTRSKPLNMSRLIPLLKIQLSPSSTYRERNETGSSSCFRLPCVLISPIGEPFTNTGRLPENTHAWIQDHLSRKPNIV